MISPRLRFVCLSMLALAAAGCGDDPASPSLQPKDDLGELVFVADPSSAGPTLYLEAVDEDPAVLRVMVRDLAPAYGVAFRLQYQADAVAMTALEAVGAWPADRIALGREASPGLFFGVISAKGDYDGLPATGLEIGRVRLASPPTAETPIAFDAGRSSVLSIAGDEQPAVAFVGGRYERR